MSRASTKLPIGSFKVTDASERSSNDWEYDHISGKYRNRFTGQLADEPDTDVPQSGTLRVSEEEEEGFTVSEEQYRAGVRLAISERSGLVRRCPTCHRRRLLDVPKEGSRFLSCAGNFVDDNENASANTCDFERKVS